MMNKEKMMIPNVEVDIDLLYVIINFYEYVCTTYMEQVHSGISVLMLPIPNKLHTSKLIQ